MANNIKKGITWRVVFGMGIMLLLSIWVSVQMFRIQLNEGEKWLAMSDSAMIRYQDISPARGNIYSDNGSLLSTSMPIYEIRWDASVVNDDTFQYYVDQLSQQLHDLFPDQSLSYFKSKLITGKKTNSKYVLIRRKVNYPDQKKMQDFPIFNKGKYGGGFLAELTTKRVKPAGNLAFRTIGYCTEDNPGVGLERSYNEDLSGVYGKRLVQKISGGYRPINDNNLVDPQNGRDVHTTINIDFQEIAQRSLEKALHKHNADHGCVLVMEVSTGHIKAISNLSRRKEGVYAEHYNYCVGESYEPGSVWKVFTAMAALEDKLVDVDDVIDIYNGERDYYGKKMKDSDKGRYAEMSFKQAFARSSNVAFSSIIFDNYANNPSKYISFLLTAYNGIINDGVMVSPQLVTKVTDAGIIIKTIDNSKNIVQVCSKETSDKIKEITAEVFLTGSARGVSSDIVPMAGKTGTAQIASSSGYQKTRMYNASFIGHFPANNPVYSIYVMVNKPSNGDFYASKVAAPVFAEVAENIFTISVKKELDKSNKHIPQYHAGYYKDMKYIDSLLGSTQNTKAEIVRNNSKTDSYKSVQLNQENMPNIIDFGAKDALYVTEILGLKPQLKGHGRVISQSPLPGEKIKKNQPVYIQLN